jgi:hypothetical protein
MYLIYLNSKKNNNKEYYKRLFTLLKKKDKFYVKKRKHLASTKYVIDENNNLYLTLPKIYKPKTNNNVTKEEEKLYTNDSEFILTEGNIENKSNEMTDDDQYDNSSIIYSDLDEDEKLELFEKLKTKNKFVINSVNPGLQK